MAALALPVMAVALTTPMCTLRVRLRHVPPCCNLLDDIRQEAKLVRGVAVVEQPVLFDGDGDGSPFDIERWNMHRSTSRYARLIPGILIGPTTRRISGTVAGATLFAALVGVYNDLARMEDPVAMGFPMAVAALPEIQLPLTPFELTSPVLGLLLVFRTDTANDRFDYGCEAVWEVTSSLRSLIRKLVAWTGRDITTDAEREAALDLIDGCLLLHGWIMGSYLRGKALKAAQEAQLLRFAAGRTEEIVQPDGFKVAMTPYLAITALSLGVSCRLPSLTDQEEVSIDEEFGKITSALGKCEKLLRAPIPLGADHRSEPMTRAKHRPSTAAEAGRLRSIHALQATRATRSASSGCGCHSFPLRLRARLQSSALAPSGPTSRSLCWRWPCCLSVLSSCPSRTSLSRLRSPLPSCPSSSATSGYSRMSGGCGRLCARLRGREMPVVQDRCSDNARRRPGMTYRRFFILMVDWFWWHARESSELLQGWVTHPRESKRNLEDQILYCARALRRGRPWSRQE